MSASTSSPSTYIPSKGTLFGHPTGLFALSNGVALQTL